MAAPTSSDSKRVAVVTGAAEGIGRGIATRLARDGFDLGLFDLPRSQARLEDLADALKKEHGTRIVLVLGDVSKEGDVKRLVDTVVGELGGLYAARNVLARCPRSMLNERARKIDDRERRDRRD